MWPFNQSKRRLRTLGRQMAELATRLEAQEHLLRRVAELTETSTQAGLEATTRLGHFERELRNVEERLEFVRREILFEMLHGARSQPTAGAPPWTVINAAGLAEGANHAIRLNLGCGHFPMPGYLNVDSRALPGVDIVADVGALQLPPGSVAEILSAHLLEHFPQEQLVRRLLPHWRTLLKRGGTFRAVVPDGQAMVAGLARGEIPYADFREVLFGGQDYSGDFHFNLFTPDSLTELLREQGFCNVRVPVAARRNGKCFEFEIVAER